MEWYQYVSAFFAGLFLTNAIPHFVNGMSGNAFPTPFAKPPGKGLSSPIVNTVWALANLLIGYLLYRFAQLSSQNNVSLIVFFAGVAAISLLSSKNFANKDKS